MPKPEVVPSVNTDDISPTERQFACSMRRPASSLNLPLVGHANTLQTALFSGIPLLDSSKSKHGQAELTADDLLIATPVVFGFSLADKLWRECLLLTYTALVYVFLSNSGVQHREDSTH